jgi:hypothetical protein
VTTLEDGSDPAPATDRRPGDPAPDPAKAPAPEPAGGIPQLARLLGAIVAPTTLLTSLLIYFGWSHAYWFFDYFGVNSTVLGLTTQDYVRRSRDGLFVPLTVAACAALVVLWAHSLLRMRLTAGSNARLLRVLLPGLAAAGLVLTAAGLWSVFATTPLHRYLAVAPLSLAIGVGLLVYAAHLWRSTRTGGPPRATWLAVAEWAGVFVLVGPQPQPGRPRGPGDPLPGPGGGLPVPLRRPQAGAAVRQPVPVPARGVDARQRGGHPHAAQR